MLPISEQYLLSPCEVKSMENVLILSGYISSITEEGLQISTKEDPLPVIHCNSTVKVSIFHNMLGFKVLIGKVYLSTSEFLRVVEIQSAAEYEKRNFFRVRVSIESSAFLLQDGGEENVQGTPFPIQIRDLSLSGMYFVCTRALKIANRVIVNLNLYDSSVSLLCKVVRKTVVEMGTADGYGCEFLDNTGHQYDLLCKYLFDCQREQIRMIRQLHP
jgi:hypothetical protein